MLDYSFAGTTDAPRDELQEFRLAHAADTTAPCGLREQQLVVDHMRLAESIARRYTGTVGDPRDIRQVAMLGLVKAVKRFDPDRGVAFAAFASPTIAGEIKRYLRDAAWMVRPPRSVQELAVTMDSVVPDLEQELGHEPTREDLADHMGVEVRDIADALHGRRGMFAANLDDLTGVASAVLTDPADEVEAVDTRLELRAAIQSLDRRNQTILSLRFGEGHSQREIADRLQMSQMQVSRAVTKSLAQLREVLEPVDTRTAA